jgi:outer membrane immunogenic protein
MKGSFLVSVGLVSLFAGPVIAADLPVKAAPPPAPYNWTGCYAGGHFGSLFEESSWGALGSHDGTGLLLGGQVGCNYQLSTWVFGIQGDAAWSNLSGTHADQLNVGLTDETKIDLLSSLTARFGYAWGRLLAYGKAGGAWTHENYNIQFADTATFASTSDTRSGWTIGGGFEYAITNNFTMFFEYNYYDFGTQTISFASVAGSSLLSDIRERDSVVKVGANWKFNW